MDNDDSSKIVKIELKLDHQSSFMDRLDKKIEKILDSLSFFSSNIAVLNKELENAKEKIDSMEQKQECNDILTRIQAIEEERSRKIWLRKKIYQLIMGFIAIIVFAWTYRFEILDVVIKILRSF